MARQLASIGVAALATTSATASITKRRLQLSLTHVLWCPSLVVIPKLAKKKSCHQRKVLTKTDRSDALS
jgi:hypothetical protein